MKITFCATLLLCLALCMQATSVQADSNKPELVWVKSKNAAISQALAEGKMILLLAGRVECGNCNLVQRSLSEYSAPDCDILGTIKKYYVPWYTNVDFSSDWTWYNIGYPQQIGLPFMALIDPANPKVEMIRWNGIPWHTTYYNNLLKFKNGAVAKTP